MSDRSVMNRGPMTLQEALPRFKPGMRMFTRLGGGYWRWFAGETSPQFQNHKDGLSYDVMDVTGYELTNACWYVEKDDEYA